jgi:phosphoglycolate phosphatase-like HAD superfamily hydrolase
MSEARKIFPINTFVACLKGEGKDANKESLLDMLNYMVGKDIDPEFEPFAIALTKAWIYEQHPELTNLSASGLAALGENVSVTPLPALAAAEASGIFEQLAEYKSTIAAKDAKIEELEGDIEAKDAKIAELQKQVKAFEDEKKGQAEELFITTEKRIEEYTKKLEELLKEVDEVKKNGVVVAGVAAAAGAGAAAPAEKEVDEDTFDFGGSSFDDEDW